MSNEGPAQEDEDQQLLVEKQLEQIEKEHTHMKDIQTLSEQTRMSRIQPVH